MTPGAEAGAGHPHGRGPRRPTALPRARVHWAQGDAELNRWLAAAVVAVFALLAVAEEVRPGGRGQVRAEVGYEAPDFTLPTAEGGHLRLSQLRGRVVVLNFWASWCPPCRAEMPELQRLHTLGDPGVVVLGVNLTFTEPAPDAPLRYLREHGYRWPVVLDRTGAVADAYGVRDIPTTYFVGADGVIRARHRGPLTFEGLLQRVQAARRWW